MNDDKGRRPNQRRTRADARRNRERILRAAVDLIIEQSPTVPMDLIARRAGVGIATLYRHFADRSVLLHHVALDTWQRCGAEATGALANEPDAFAALSRYMHRAVDLRIGTLMPVLVERIELDDELLTARRTCREATDGLVEAAHREGSLRQDITNGDIGLLITRLTSPLPNAMDPECNHQLSHRHLELLLDGLLRVMSVKDLPGPTMSSEALTRFPPILGYAGVMTGPRTDDHSLCHPL